MVYEEGVSPVIATILMVAITVVLAATLYIMVTGNMLGTPYSSAKLVGSLTMSPDKSYKYSVNFTIAMSEPEAADKSNIRITVVHGNLVGAMVYSSTAKLWTNATAGGKWHYEAKLLDANADNKFSDGDKLWVYVVDDNTSDGVTPPPFVTGDKVLFTITGYHGVSGGGDVQL